MQSSYADSSFSVFANFKVFAARVVLQGNIVFFFHNKKQRCFLQFRLSSSILFCWESLTSLTPFSLTVWSSILSKPSRQETFQCHWWLRLSHYPNSLLFRGENNHVGVELLHFVLQFITQRLYWIDYLLQVIIYRNAFFVSRSFSP